MVVLIVEFKQTGVSIAEARSVNEVVVPMIGAKPGFISKMWLGIDDTGEFAGVHQFATKEDAEAYVCLDSSAQLVAHDHCCAVHGESANLAT